MSTSDPATTGRAAAHALLDRLGPAPPLAIVLGSGLARFVEALQPSASLSYQDLHPSLAPSVPGHPGRVVAGSLAARRLWVFQGRFHLYEGLSFDQITLTGRAIAEAGCPRLLLTNAAGGIRPDLAPGDWMLISDHLNLPGLAGHNPLIGLDDPPGGSRFLDLSDAYCPELRRILRQVATARNITLHQGVYCYVAGPHYETPAEVRFLAQIGADAVGMSTVPEVLMARRHGLSVAALACIANGAAIETATISHTDVLAAVDRSVPSLIALVEGLLLALEESGLGT